MISFDPLQYHLKNHLAILFVSVFSYKSIKANKFVIYLLISPQHSIKTQYEYYINKS